MDHDLVQEIGTRQMIHDEETVDHSITTDGLDPVLVTIIRHVIGKSHTKEALVIGEIQGTEDEARDTEVDRIRNHEDQLQEKNTEKNGDNQNPTENIEVTVEIKEPVTEKINTTDEDHEVMMRHDLIEALTHDM